MASESDCDLGPGGRSDSGWVRPGPGLYKDSLPRGFRRTLLGDDHRTDVCSDFTNKDMQADEVMCSGPRGL